MDESETESDDGSETEPEVVTYSGGVDSEQRYHGRATVTYTDGSTFRGRYWHGQRHGTGETAFADGSSMRGSFANDELDGTGTYLYEGGDSIVCTYKGGEMDGPFREVMADGWVSCTGSMNGGAQRCTRR